MDMRFRTWNVRSLHRVGSLMTVAKVIAKYKLDFVEVQKERWDIGGTEPAGEYTFSYEKRNEDHELGTDFFVHKRIISAIKRVEFVGDKMSYIILRNCWCDITVLDVHALTEAKIDDMKVRFSEELECVFHKFPKYHMNIKLGDFNAKAGREDIFKPTIGKEILHKISNDGVRVVNGHIQKILFLKA
jgi:exonuclease III